MGYAPVKSNPYKPKRSKCSVGPLWPDAVWSAIVERAKFGMDYLDIIIAANNELPIKYRPQRLLNGVEQ